MEGVTNRISFEEASDLLTRPTRACVGFVAEGAPRVEPVDFRYDGSRFMVSTPDERLRAVLPDEAVLVIDEGLLFFDLRAIYVRGTPRRAAGTEDNDLWFELDPTKVSCWDYGRLRVTDDGH